MVQMYFMQLYQLKGVSIAFTYQLMSWLVNKVPALNGTPKISLSLDIDREVSYLEKVQDSFSQFNSCFLLCLHKYWLFVCRVFHITKLYFSYAIFVTYLVQFYVPMDFLEPTRFKSKTLHCDTTGKPKRTYLGQIVFRTTLVVITGLCFYKQDYLFLQNCTKLCKHNYSRPLVLM